MSLCSSKSICEDACLKLVGRVCACMCAYMWYMLDKGKAGQPEETQVKGSTEGFHLA